MAARASASASAASCCLISPISVSPVRAPTPVGSIPYSAGSQNRTRIAPAARPQEGRTDQAAGGGRNGLDVLCGCENPRFCPQGALGASKRYSHGSALLSGDKIAGDLQAHQCKAGHYHQDIRGIGLPREGRPCPPVVIAVRIRASAISWPSSTPTLKAMRFPSRPSGEIS